MNTGLATKTVLITGAENPRGIGAATARAFAAEGAAVFVTHFGPVSPDDVVADIRTRGGRIGFCEADLADTSIIPGLFDRVERTCGPVDVLIHNAAHGDQDSFLPREVATRDWAGRPMEPVTAASHDAHFAVNSRATAMLIAEFACRHIARKADWGRIVTISTGGAPGFANEVSYGASKAALESYSRAAARELARFGITVNIVSPGPIQTGWMTPEVENAIAREIPLGRIGRPEDVADAIVLLSTEQARWLTGQILHAGGGHRMI